MAYSIPAGPDLDLTGLLDSVSDLAKKAIAGGVFLGDIEDIADSYDVTAATTTSIDELASQKFSALACILHSLIQTDERADSSLASAGVGRPRILYFSPGDPLN